MRKYDKMSHDIKRNFHLYGCLKMINADSFNFATRKN